MMKAVKILKMIMLGVLVFGINTGIASAALITGGMGIGGGYTADATTLTLTSVTGNSGTGILGTTVGFGTVGSIISGVDGGVDGVIDYNPFTPVTNLLEIGGWTLDLSTLIIDPASTTANLKLSGTGVLTGGGYDPTAATWRLSTTSTGGSYSMSITAVPVPAAVWLFGSGLIGLIGIARRKVQAID